MWQVHSQLELHWCDWGEDSVVFDSRSGHTHKFAPLAAAVLACLEEHPCSLADLRRELHLDAEPGSAEAAQIDAALEAAVDQFVALRWVAQVLPG